MLLQLDFQGLINTTTFIELLVFTGYLIFFSHVSLRLSLALSGVFFCFIAGKFDDLLQQSSQIFAYPNIAFFGASASLLLAPAMLYYVYVRTHSEFEFKTRYCLHLLVAVPPTTYLFFAWWRHSAPEKLQLLESGAFANEMTLLVLPAYNDMVLLSYLTMCISLLRKHGISIQNWFSNTLPVEMKGLRNTLTMFAIMLVLHLGWIAARGYWHSPTLSWWLMAALVTFHLLLINTLFIEFLTHKPLEVEFEPVEETIHTLSVENAADLEKYQDIVSSLQSYLTKDPIYLNPDLTISQLARALKLHHREVSKAINQIQKQTFLSSLMPDVSNLRNNNWLNSWIQVFSILPTSLASTANPLLIWPLKNTLALHPHNLNSNCKKQVRIREFGRNDSQSVASLYAHSPFRIRLFKRISTMQTNQTLKSMPLWQSCTLFWIPGLITTLLFTSGFTYLKSVGFSHDRALWIIAMISFSLLIPVTVFFYVKEGNAFTWNAFKTRLRLQAMDKQAWKYTAIAYVIVLGAYIGLLFTAQWYKDNFGVAQ